MSFDLKNFKQCNTLQHRRLLSEKIKTLYSDRIPVIVSPHNSTKYIKITKQKYLAPGDITFGKFLLEVRKNIIKLEEKDSLFFFVENGSLIVGNMTMSEINKHHMDPDGFLYLTYATENTFG